MSHRFALSLALSLALGLAVSGCSKKKSSSSDDDDGDRQAQSDDDGDSKKSKKSDTAGDPARAEALRLAGVADADEAKAAGDPKKPDEDAAKTFSGTWKTAWGPVTLVQDGKQVSGRYAGRFSGKLEGEYDGSSLRLSWIQTNGERGKAIFVLSPEGERFSGTWGSGASATSGGAWNGTRLK